MATLLLLLTPPVLSAALAAVVRPYRRAVGWANAFLSLVSVGGALALWAHVLAGHVVTAGPGAFLRVDALSALLGFGVSVVGALAAWLGPGLSRGEDYDATQTRRFRIFANLFTFTMLFAVSTSSVGVMWIAIEATTITSAVLIPLHLSKASVEASWKYILLSSVGIALAFAGTVLAYVDFVAIVGRQAAALNWPVLVAAAPLLHPEVMRLAFVFVLVGYGTKAGLAPMHTWLPDAHAEAPAPLSAMMSGVLLAVALYAVMRWAAVANATLGAAFTDQFLLGLGLLSLGMAAFSLVRQHNYKRLLAYSSIEHTGLVCVGLGLGPLGTFAAMLHLLNHTLAKSMLFFLSGRVLQRYQTTRIGEVSGLLQTMPVTGGLFAAGLLALAGLPPFGIFISEFALLRAGFPAGRFWAMGLVLLLLTVAFVGVIAHLNRMLYGAPSTGVPHGEPSRWPLVPLALCLAALVALGLTIPSPLERLIAGIVEELGS